MSRPAFAAPTSVTITAPVSQTVPCPQGVSAPCVNLTHGQSVQFSGTLNGTGTFNPALVWSYGPTLGTLNTSTGLYTAPTSIFQTQQITITAYSAQTPSVFATATVFLIPTVAISISPTTATVSDGQRVNFTAPVTGTQNVAVTWSLQNNAVGTIQDTGIQFINNAFVATATYTAPLPVAGKSTDTVTAVSVAAPNQQAVATVNLVPAAAVGVTVNPPSVSLRAGETQQFSATVVGLNSTAVTWSVACAPLTAAGLPQTCSSDIGQFSGATYIAPKSVGFTELLTVTATSVATDVNGNNLTGTANVTLTPPALTVSPSSVTLATNQSQQFTAMLNGAPYTNVTWSINSGFGSISATGLYTAPAFAPAKLSIQVIATDNADPSGTHTGTATVTIGQSAASITPSSVSMSIGGPVAPTQQFSFNIDGVPDANPAQDVIWTLQPNVGTITAAGLYTPPSGISAGVTITLTGTFLLDPSKTAKATIALTLYTDVGHGAPSFAIQELFVTNFYRNNFNLLVSLPPLGDVKKLGATGFVQEFQDANKTSGVKLALVKPNSSTAIPATGAPLVFQMLGDVYGYYTSVGVTTAGYPTSDTMNCPFIDGTNTCTFDIFDKGVALFVYKLPVFAAQTQFTINGVFYTKWNALGGIGGPGLPRDAVVTGVASPTTNTASVQTYSNGAIYQITKGTNNSQVFAVLGAVYTYYVSQGGPTAYLGLPTSDEITLANGDHRQTFEGGAIQYTPSQTPPVVRLPVGSVAVAGASTGGSLHMNVGDTTTLSATAFTTGGALLSDRPFTWSTSNGQVVTVSKTSGTNNSTATITAVGGGTASIRASADGVVSPAFNISVTAQCCQVGEGAPTQIISQAFQNAVTRNHLTIVLPAQNPVQRMGHGYIQQLQDATPGSNLTYLLAKSDNLPAAYVVMGAILTRYQSPQIGGPAGSLGYPTQDPSPGGTQTFENNAALAGNPVLLVSGTVFTKWSAMGLETGAAGIPVAEAGTFKTIGANAGNQQTFQNGVIFAATSGPRAGQAYFVSGLILTAFNGVGGPGGAYGMPTSDEFVSGATHRQNFEGGFIDYSVGASVAQVHPASQKPAIAAPGSVLAGSRVHLAVTGFQPGATIQVAVTGQPTFTVTVANGAYSWDVYVPLTAKAATVNIQANDTASSDAASATYTILSLANNRATFTKVQGDVQSGVPGGLLAQPIVAALVDPSGNPVIGAPVVFQASPGAQVVQATAITDQNGQAQARLRMPLNQGLAAITVDSPGIAAAPVIFYATATSSALTSFPKMSQTSTAAIGNGTATIAQKGSLLVAAASILRYYQANGAMSAPNGLADPATLNQFLKSFCTADSFGRQVCDGFLVNPDSGEQVVNLWRLNDFVGGGVDIVPLGADLNSIRDAVAAGSPVLISLAVTADASKQAAGHYVVATGVGPGGEVLIQDPNPALAAPQLDSYLNGFIGGAHNWTGTVLSAVRLVPQTPAATGFLLMSVSQPSDLAQMLTLQASSAAGKCGQPVSLTDAFDPTAALPSAALRISRFVYCDGSQPVYQADVGVAQSFGAGLTDLAKGGSFSDLSGAAPASYRLTRPSQLLVVAPQDLELLDGGIVNAASLLPGIAPGGLFTIRGSGLSGAGSSSVTVNGETAPVTFTSPFQINAQVPADVAPGSYIVQVQSPFGLGSQQVDVAANAPGIFLLGSTTQGAVVNADNSTNSNTNPVVRGQTIVIYCTGLGTVARQGNFMVTTAPVTVVLAGAQLKPTFAGLSAGLVGVYQVNVVIPAGSPPGLDLPMWLSQGSATSNSVALSVQ